MENSSQSRKWKLFRDNFLSYGFIALAILFQSASGVFGKFASEAAESGPLSIFNGFYILSIGCLVLQAIIWQKVLQRFPLSIAYPMMSLMNFIILLASYALFSESITSWNIIGLLIITLGVYMLSQELDTI